MLFLLTRWKGKVQKRMAMSSLSLLDSEESLPSVYIIASLSSANLRL